MLAFTARRLGQSLFVLAAMSFLVFVGVYLVGNPIELLVNPQADEVERARATAALGLDKPFLAQFGTFVVHALHGDLGRSFVYNIPAIQLILDKLPATLELAAAAMVLAIVIGIPLGLVAGLKPDSWVGRSIMAGSILGFSLPTFLVRLTRAGTREALLQDYVKFARAKGLSPGRVIGVHVLKNILIPIVTVIGLELGSVIAFAVVTESIFAWPGSGKLLIDSLNQLDRPVIVAYLLVTVTIFIAINFVVDVVYSMLDPRVRLGGAAAAH